MAKSLAEESEESADGEEEEENMTDGSAGVELRPFFTKILAWTTFVHFSNPGAKNPCLDAILRDFPSRSSEIRMLKSNESLFVIRNENNPI